MASGLVKAYGGHDFVYLHLLCQGFENIGKAIILAQDYEAYGPQLKSIGHDIESLLAEVEKSTGKIILSNSARQELLKLNRFYKNHQLRYGDAFDYSINIESLSGEEFRGDLIKNLDVWNEQFATLANV